MSAELTVQERTSKAMASYDEAIRWMEICRENLDLRGLKVIEATETALRGLAQLCQDPRLKQKAWELRIERNLTAARMAEEIRKRDNPIVKRGSRGGMQPIGARVAWRDTCAPQCPD